MRFLSIRLVPVAMIVLAAPSTARAQSWDPGAPVGVALRLAPRWSLTGGVFGAGGGATLARRTPFGLDVGVGISGPHMAPTTVSPLVRLAVATLQHSVITRPYLELTRQVPFRHPGPDDPHVLRWALIFGGQILPLKAGVTMDGGFGVQWTRGHGGLGPLAGPALHASVGWAWGGPALRDD